MNPTTSTDPSPHSVAPTSEIEPLTPEQRRPEANSSGPRGSAASAVPERFSSPSNSQAGLDASWAAYQRRVDGIPAEGDVPAEYWDRIGPRGLTMRGEVLRADFLSRYPGASSVQGRTEEAPTPQDLQDRWTRYQERLAEIDAHDDDPPGWWERFVREMNEERRLEGRGPAFAESEG